MLNASMALLIRSVSWIECTPFTPLQSGRMAMNRTMIRPLCQASASLSRKLSFTRRPRESGKVNCTITWRNPLGTSVLFWK